MTKELRKRGRPVDHTRGDHIMCVAVNLFLKQGFTSTSMDQIAKEAGVSKLTLYKRFSDKNVLFAQVMAERCKRYIPDELFEVFNSKSPRDALYTVGLALFTLMNSDDAVGLYRMMVSDAVASPDLVNLFYERGPRRTKSILAGKMAQLHKTGALNIPDPETATEYFVALFKGSDIHMRTLLGRGKKPTAKEFETHARRVADFFVKAYAK